ncbi:hypothetical protein [Nonomuraea sp. SYSU D8015]|uniref:hypothetical protein n=1 Tax=Nonomuraea sp. SYSU D8015 TaxID=2593644 RepID=UPI001660086F|nr:hypothetical protein [Nonomuraea sp. SYSU D8015]
MRAPARRGRPAGVGRPARRAQPRQVRACERCTLADKVTAALDDGTDRINPALAPPAEALIAMRDPWKGRMWLRTTHVQDLLTSLAGGRIPLTHQALHQLPNRRTPPACAT